MPSGWTPATGVPVHRRAPPGQADEAHRARLQPRHEPLDAREPGAVLVARQLVGAWCRPLHEVGHADAVDATRRVDPGPR